MTGTAAQCLTLEAARRELGLRREEFTLGIEHGVIRTCWSGGELCVRAGEVVRWRAAPGELAELTRLVHATETAGLAGISRHRFDQLARAGAIRPVRSYTNRCHAEVWQYSAAGARQLPERRPELFGARLPGCPAPGRRVGLQERGAVLVEPEHGALLALLGVTATVRAPPPASKAISRSAPASR
ncbi:DUF6397 family protein [Streptomyces sp. NBC_00286]|uniref:DUF6397 family protein n=1 Tax=Streptomyces sp. NBC_00286 TaxID=2975701 RepID=UPI003FA79B67